MGVSRKNVSKTDTDIIFGGCCGLEHFPDIVNAVDALVRSPFLGLYMHATDAGNISCLTFLIAHFSRDY